METPVRELADRFHERWLRAHPFTASLYGIPGYDDRVPDDSEAGEAAWRAELESMLADARRFERSPLADADAITLGCLVENIDQEVRELDSRLLEHDVSAMPFTGPAVLLATAARTVIGDDQAAADYLERLRHSGQWVYQQTERPRIGAAKRALEERAREEAKAAEQAEWEEKKKEEAAKKAIPKDTDQYNFTDAESRIMKGADGFVQGYNAQIAVEPVLQLIVGQYLTQAGNDKKQLLPMIKVVEQQSGQKPSQVLADSGYTSEASITESAAAGIDAYLAVARDKHNQQAGPCARGPLPRDASGKERMRRKLQTKAGRVIYAARKAIVEPVFGQIKQARGFRQFLLRGVEKAGGEWALVCTAHNVLKLHRLLCT